MIDQTAELMMNDNHHYDHDDDHDPASVSLTLSLDYVINVKRIPHTKSNSHCQNLQIQGL